jgi:uncharacterized protein
MIKRLVFPVLAALLLGGIAAPSARAEGSLFDDPKDSVAGAAGIDDAARIHKYLERGDNPNNSDREGRPALVLAAINGDTLITKMLLDAKARVNAPDKEGNTALHWAAKRGHEDVVLLLLAAKAPVDAQNREGATPLMLAAGAGQTAVLKMLLAAHADTSAQDYSGHDALSWAEDNRHPPCVQLLRKAMAAR